MHDSVEQDVEFETLYGHAKNRVRRTQWTHAFQIAECRFRTYLSDFKGPHKPIVCHQMTVLITGPIVTAKRDQTFDDLNRSE